ncbi:hypothetical protein [Prauserella rugosa]|uniref:PA containing protein n=1 Tax=Prauserella rugosa TaxID=43354 RepID=A0A660CG72_9PSEU|nr:hypothetical protein [Prauserella rugosa]KID32647.1 hypothetical protein HQ32_00516 [Prauserella sp. Am3]KMS87325.1 PA containing protein [Streptomyces regensis]TWH22346.1 hypothetical protein JD82_04223 [Prauserella rugosa]
MTTDNQLAAPSFDRMRNMLVRAAEVRESEQQQIFDALDDIYARLAPVDSLGAVRKRLSELPDRTEVGVLAERLDEAMTRMEAQDNAIAELGRSVEAIVDKLAKPFAQLDGRLEGVAAKFEAVAGRMDGLEDKLENIHRRIDELGGHLSKQDDKLDAMPTTVGTPVRERIDALETGLKERLERLESDAKERITASTETVKTTVSETAEAIDPTERLEKLAERLEQVTGKLDDLSTRVDKVEDDVTGRIGDLDGSVRSGFAGVESTLSKQPDSDEVTSVVQKSGEESVRRIGGQLDEAMATFAELMLGGGPAPQTVAVQPPAPRQPRRRNGGSRQKADAKAKNNGSSPDDADD